MNKIKQYIVKSTLLITLIFTGCGTTTESVYGDNTIAPELAEVTIYDTYLDLITPKAYNDTSGLELEAGSVISIIAPNKSTDYWNSFKSGTEKAIEDINLDLGYSGKNSITLSYNTPSNSGDVEDMINILDSELSRYPAAIAIGITDPYAYGMQFDQALDNGIPIVGFESESYSATLSATVATDYAATATELFSKMSELIGDQDGKVLILAPEVSSDASSKKIETLGDNFENVDNLTLVDIFDLTSLTTIKMEMLSDRTWVHNNLSGDDNTIASNPNHDLYDDLLKKIDNSSVLTYTLNNTEEINGFITLDEECNTLLADTLSTSNSNYDDLSILTFTNSEQALSLLDDGILDGLMITNPYGMGYATVVATIRAALDMGNEALINPGTMWQDN